MPLANDYRALLERLPTLAVNADQVQVLHSARSFKQRLLELIATAHTRIYLAALYLQDDAAGREILTALYEAKQARPGLDIRLFVDFHRAQRGLIGHQGQGGNHRMYQEFSARYAEPIAIYGVPVKGREILGVLHLKGFVFDETLLYSGASLNDIYLHQEDRYRFDRYHQFTDARLADTMVDYMDRLFADNPAVPLLTAEPIPGARQLRHAIRQFKQQMKRTRYEFESMPRREGQVAITPLAGLGKLGNRLNRAIRNLLRSPRETLFICTPYFNLPKPLARDIRGLLKKGIEVTLVIGDKTANDFYIPPEQPFRTIGGLPYLYETNLRRFARAHQTYIYQGKLNIMLWHHDRNSYHLKGLFVDDDLAMITGNNLNPRAWGLDLENGLLVQDPDRLLQAKFEAEKANILEHCQRLEHFSEIEELCDYPAPVQKLLKRVQRTRANVLLKRLL
ncbi:CDP-diacylglycerol--serine O-phosphatidyltransferase [Oceanisphaera litoralis]|uniref:CDP-diacylglycerol--serine O-phosphatidyltransferase n=1 Tax=Oceanisphaera litoralis TaxID=225144 RepID=UPI001958EF89|nr:CDP-diacylglycerol--serine O-phosphatidyltransferase [Oceanisphaera litoralis]MBM7456191.1 CDP-diacylglycerol--serine O-phosphatidyltransferase [Oceanisphaera litoralis]